MSFRGYISSRDLVNGRAPQHVQNIVIRAYCEKNNLNFLLSGVEYGISNSYQMLIQIINELNNLDGIICYTLFQFPEDQIARRQFFYKILEKNKSIHFAVEHLIVNDFESLEKVEEIYYLNTIIHNSNGIYADIENKLKKISNE
jgi:sporadic carbohydrate cluster protein (TIGR04323 family)|tara:strand:+ start:1277 stop:1708 length:432 start_codon:yes stop_codon:yes gene_type:complete